MVQNGIFLTIGGKYYFVYYPIISYQRIKFYRVKNNGYGKIPLEQWCQWDGSHIHKYYGTYCIALLPDPEEFWLVTFRNMSRHALMGRPPTRMETMVLMK